MSWQTMAAIGGAVGLVAIVFVIVWWVRKHRTLPSNQIGAEFEKYCAELLWKNGFRDVKLTGASGDFGVDVFAKKDGVTWAFQCKCYDKPVGIRAVQEIYSGRDFYRCMVGVVMTNNTYTGAAVELARAHNILLWDGAVLKEMAKKN